MRSVRHSIHRQSLEVSFQRPGQEKAMQDRLATVYYRQVLPKIETLFNEFSSTHLVIPALTIDCGQITELNWEHELTNRIIDQLRSELAARQRSAPQIQQQLSQQVADELMYFLKRGQFQWDTRSQSVTDLEALATIDEHFISKLVATLRTSTHASQRFFFYLSGKFIRRVYGAVRKRLPQDEAAYITFLEQAGVEARSLIRQVINAYVVSSNQTAVQASFPTTLTSMIWPVTTAGVKSIIVNQIGLAIKASADKAEKKAEEDLDIPAAANNFLKAHLNIHLKASFILKAPFILKTPFTAAFSALISAEFPQAATSIRQYGKSGTPAAPRSGHSAATEKEARQQHEEPEHLDSYYISNVGLIIAYPFFEALLQQASLLEKDKPFSLDNRRKATILLQQLVVEAPTVQEAPLTLNKILCGLQPETFVDPTSFTFTESEKKECEAVLHAIIEHWPILRNTSIQGLRETFLQRDGKLMPKQSNWTLQVDSRGVDVLLSSLPWSIGVIKLPWMDNMLHVTWTS